MSWIKSILAVVVILVAACGVQVQAQARAGEKAEEKNKSEAIPQPVTDALKKLAKESKVAVEAKGKEGARHYEAEWKTDGKSHEAILSATGDVLYTKDDVDAKDVPKAVQDAAKAKSGTNSTLSYVAIHITKGEKTFYEVAATNEGKKQELYFAADGSQVDEDDTEYEGEDEEGEEDDDDDRG